MLDNFDLRYRRLNIKKKIYQLEIFIEVKLSFVIDHLTTFNPIKSSRLYYIKSWVGKFLNLSYMG